MKKKVTVIGHFYTGYEAADGQTVKTRIVTRELEAAVGADQVHRIDTYGWKKNPLKLVLNCAMAVQNSANVIFMTDAGGIKVFPWLLQGLNILRKCRLHYVVVGGWLVGYLEKHPMIAACLKRFHGIIVETQVLKAGLEAIGFQNIQVMPNFKNLAVLPAEKLVYSGEPYGFCTFSRVMEEKGIADAVEAVRAVNESCGRTVCTLDIYGQVDAAQTEWFENLRRQFPAEVRYCGVVPYEQSVDVLKTYHALLFPTKFYTEGIPGTIIDAYAAGVPVVASRWESCGDVIEHGKTGIVYPFGETDALKDILMEVTAEPERIYAMKENCLAGAKQYLPEAGIEILLSRLA